MNNGFPHLHPAVRQHAVKFAYTFCLGACRSSCSSPVLTVTACT